MEKKGGDGRRVQRMERELQQSVAKFLITSFKTPLPGLVTISKVVMPGDLRTAKVYVSVLGDDDAKEQVMDVLEDRAFEIQKFLGHELKSRYTPKLFFILDETTDKVLKIDEILKELEEERKRK